MEQFCYREIFRKNLLQFSKKLGLENILIFQDDNDPKRTARIIKEWLKQKTD